MRTWPISLALLCLACRGSMSPLSNRLKVGQEAYLVFAADAPGGTTDLFASAPVGGAAYQFTFTPLEERFPALSPAGEAVAFVRAADTAPDAPASVWVMNLLNGAERQVVEAGRVTPTGLGWSADGTELFVGTTTGPLVVAAPPARKEASTVPAARRAEADSALAIRLGEPVIALAVPCAEGSGFCARGSGGGESVLTRTGTGLVRWGSDSVGYFEGERLVVRPLGGGQVRVVNWSRPPARPHDVSYFPGPRD